MLLYFELYYRYFCGADLEASCQWFIMQDQANSLVGLGTSFRPPWLWDSSVMELWHWGSGVAGVIINGKVLQCFKYSSWEIEIEYGNRGDCVFLATGSTSLRYCSLISFVVPLSSRGWNSKLFMNLLKMKVAKETKINGLKRMGRPKCRKQGMSTDEISRCLEWWMC